MPTSSGRTVCVAQWGPPSGTPVLFLHGTPGSRVARYVDDDTLARLDVRLITVDRAGYGRSDRSPGRSVADVAADVAAVAGALECTWLPVLGYSGGGPHALACAGLLPGLVPAAGVVSGIAPFDARGLDWFAGMNDLNIEEFGAAVRGRAALEALLDPAAAGMVATPEQVATELAAGLPRADAEVLDRADVRAVLTDSIREGLRNGAGGWVDDDLAFVRPWGFDTAAIDVPVALWHGTADTLAPRSHAAWLAAEVPGCALHERAGVGHLGMTDRHAEALAWLLARAGIPPG